MSIKPTQKQLEFLDWEIGVFFHFGIRTFFEGHVDWDGKEMPACGFNPTELNCEQWIETAKAGGAKYAVLTTKHHDGFANWPSAYSDYSVKNTPWKEGKGDVVKEFTDACRKLGVKVGLYYSPAQKDYKLMDGKEYDDYFVNQITELLSNYGKIDYIWFDGCGSEGHEYDTQRIVNVIRTLQPEIMIFDLWDPDTRWVGNEEGVTPCGKGYEVSAVRHSVNETEDTVIEPKFLPYECDCKVRRNNWFYSEYDSHLLRSSEDLVSLYDYSVGRGGNLLLNFAPDRRGLIPKQDGANFRRMREMLEDRFAKPIPCKITKEGNLYKIDLEEPGSINTVVLEEELAEGQKIRKYTFNSRNAAWDADWGVNIPLYQGDFVGHKRIVTFPQMWSKRFCLTIDDAEEGYVLNKIRLYMS